MNITVCPHCNETSLRVYEQTGILLAECRNETCESYMITRERKGYANIDLAAYARVRKMLLSNETISYKEALKSKFKCT